MKWAGSLARAYINNIRQYRIKIRIFLASNNGPCGAPTKEMPAIMSVAAVMVVVVTVGAHVGGGSMVAAAAFIKVIKQSNNNCVE